MVVVVVAVNASLLPTPLGLLLVSCSGDGGYHPSNLLHFSCGGGGTRAVMILYVGAWMVVAVALMISNGVVV